MNSKRKRVECPLIDGPYHAPRVRKGHRTFCHYRDADVVITGWSDGRIPWPRCRALDSRGGSGILIDDELARAIRTESAAAIMHWWGVTCSAVALWRRALDSTRINNRGSQRLIRSAAAQGGAAMREHEFTASERATRRRNAIRLKLGQHLKPGYQGRWWSKREIALLARHSDEEVAKRTGRTTDAVRRMRYVVASRES